MWKSLSGTRGDDIVQAVHALVGDDDRVIHIGTDAQNRGFTTHFVTVVAVVNPGHGARVFYQRRRRQHVSSLAEKLFYEAELSIQAALHLDEGLPQDIVVHLDANEDQRHRSSRYVKSLAGMVMGYGFGVRVKPNSWCATHVADYVVKDKHGKVA